MEIPFTESKQTKLAHFDYNSQAVLSEALRCFCERGECYKNICVHSAQMPQIESRPAAHTHTRTHIYCMCILEIRVVSRTTNDDVSRRTRSRLLAKCQKYIREKNRKFEEKNQKKRMKTNNWRIFRAEQAKLRLAFQNFDMSEQNRKEQNRTEQNSSNATSGRWRRPRKIFIISAWRAARGGGG